MSETKEIRFIDPHYKELFRIPDGGRIVVTRPEGEQWVGDCKYLDEAHVSINGECYHICQFAEIQQRIGSTYEPEAEPEMVGSYRITHRIFVGDKVYKLGYSPHAVEPFATWQGYSDPARGSDWGHYWSKQSDAWGDLLCRANAERTGIPYDHTKRYKQKTRDDGAR